MYDKNVVHKSHFEILPRCNCGKFATKATLWRTPVMHAPAFWYDCDECFPKTQAVLERDQNVTSETREV